MQYEELPPADKKFDMGSFPRLPDQHNSGGANVGSETEYMKVLARWMYLDRGDDSLDSAHADCSSFRSID